MSAPKLRRRQRRIRARRTKVERLVHRDRTAPGRVMRVHPEPGRPFVVEVRLAANRRRMREAMSFHEGGDFAASIESNCMGLVRTWQGPRTGRAGVLLPRMVVARMFLNVRDLRRCGTLVISHECGHAALGYARFLGIGLGAAQRSMPAEEVVCYAIGELTSQIVRGCYARGVW